MNWLNLNSVVITGNTDVTKVVANVDDILTALKTANLKDAVTVTLSDEGIFGCTTITSHLLLFEHFSTTVRPVIVQIYGTTASDEDTTDVATNLKMLLLLMSLLLLL